MTPFQYSRYSKPVQTESNAPFFVDREEIVLNKNGVWLSDGVEISHEPTRRLFAQSLRRDAGGYFLRIGNETKRIQVEDTPYFVQRIDGSPEEGYSVWINDDSQERLIPESLRYLPGRLTCRLSTQHRDGEEAKFLSTAYYGILRHLQEDQDFYFLRIGNARVNLAKK